MSIVQVCRHLCSLPWIEARKTKITHPQFKDLYNSAFMTKFLSSFNDNFDLYTTSWESSFADEEDRQDCEDFIKTMFTLSKHDDNVQLSSGQFYLLINVLLASHFDERNIVQKGFRALTKPLEKANIISKSNTWSALQTNFFELCQSLLLSQVEQTIIYSNNTSSGPKTEYFNCINVDEDKKKWFTDYSVIELKTTFIDVLWNKWNAQADQIVRNKFTVFPQIMIFIFSDIFDRFTCHPDDIIVFNDNNRLKRHVYKIEYLFAHYTTNEIQKIEQEYPDDDEKHSIPPTVEVQVEHYLSMDAIKKRKTPFIIDLIVLRKVM